MDKDERIDLPDIVDRIAGRPERFIPLYTTTLLLKPARPPKAPKSVLDASVAAAPTCADHATSNRRHLMPEYFAENLETKYVGDEIHPGETTEGKNVAFRAFRPLGFFTPSTRTITQPSSPTGWRVSASPPAAIAAASGTPLTSPPPRWSPGSSPRTGRAPTRCLTPVVESPPPSSCAPATGKFPAQRPPGKLSRASGEFPGGNGRGRRWARRWCANCGKSWGSLPRRRRRKL